MTIDQSALLKHFGKHLVFLGIAAPAALFLTLDPDAHGISNEGGLRCDPAARWRTVDIYRGEKGRRGAPIPTDAAASSNAVYLVGNAGGGVENWVVRRSLDEGENWSTVDRYIKPGREYSVASSVAVDPRDGTVYVAGVGGARGGRFHGWIIRRSSDHGKTWETIDDLRDRATVRRIRVDSNGVIYAAGTSKSNHAVLRRSTDGGKIWHETVLPSRAFRASALAISEKGAVFLAGTSREKWMVLFSPDGKTKWEHVDEWPIPDRGGQIYDGAVSGDGRVVFIGSGFRPEGDRWVIRESTFTNPKRWISPDIELDDGRAMAVTAHPDGRIYASGRTSARIEQMHAYSTRLLTDDSRAALFSDSVLQDGGFLEDRFLFPQAAAVTTHLGNVITAGYLNTDEGSVWLVRKLACR